MENPPLPADMVPSDLCNHIAELKEFFGRPLQMIDNDNLIKVGKAVDAFSKETKDPYLQNISSRFLENCKLEYKTRNVSH